MFQEKEFLNLVLNQQPCKTTCRLLITESTWISTGGIWFPWCFPSYHFTLSMLFCLETRAHYVALVALELTEIYGSAFRVPGLKSCIPRAHTYSYNTEHWQDSAEPASAPHSAAWSKHLQDSYLPSASSAPSMSKRSFFSGLGGLPPSALLLSTRSLLHTIWFIFWNFSDVYNLQSSYLKSLNNILKLAGVNFILRHVKSQAEGIS